MLEQDLIPGKLYKLNYSIILAFYDKEQKQFESINRDDILMYLNTEPFEDGFKKCIHIHIILKDKLLYIEKPTLARFLSQIKLL